ncbi:MULTISPECIES: LLM class flavin-dependent oxidoreductase [unclassified Pseudonocardia]|uniref:LLM class flavin-dependent oxidoreductase n=1 Tax=unclassified Pseudonocardia TaxID=2619320 RepID=UPI001D054759|nr:MULTISPECIES: LLM class flavin-dependent oxidoreductase [unclassified Pseudonocardia]
MSRVNWGVLTHASGPRDSAAELSDTVRLAVLAEELGFGSFWIAQHHLGAQQGHASSPLVVLAAVAARTGRIRLGTAVVVGPLEQPLRLAEDAATVDALSGGRLELGVGAGSDAGAADAFGVRPEERHARLAEVLDVLVRADVVPSVRGLRGRTWLATSSEDGVAVAAARGLGLLSGRRSGPSGPDDVRSARLLARFRALGGRRVGLSRPVVPGASRVAVHDLLAPHVARWGRDPAAHLRAGNVYAGTEQEVAAGLAADPCLPYATDLLCHVQPARLPFAELEPVVRRTAALADRVPPVPAGPARDRRAGPAGGGPAGQPGSGTSRRAEPS